jgi:hypothetical protein
MLLGLLFHSWLLLLQGLQQLLYHLPSIRCHAQPLRYGQQQLRYVSQSPQLPSPASLRAAVGAQAAEPRVAVQAGRSGAKARGGNSSRDGPGPGAVGPAARQVGLSPQAGGLSTTRPIRVRSTPSALSDFVHTAGTHVPVPAGRIAQR